MVIVNSPSMSAVSVAAAARRHNSRRQEIGNGQAVHACVISAKSSLVQEGLLLRRGRAAQKAIAMGEAPEPPDDVGVVLGPFQVFGMAGRVRTARCSATGRADAPNA